MFYKIKKLEVLLLAVKSSRQLYYELDLRGILHNIVHVNRVFGIRCVFYEFNNKDVWMLIVFKKHKT